MTIEGDTINKAKQIRDLAFLADRAREKGQPDVEERLLEIANRIKNELTEKGTEENQTRP